MSSLAAASSRERWPEMMLCAMLSSLLMLGMVKLSCLGRLFFFDVNGSYKIICYGGKNVVCL